MTFDVIGLCGMGYRFNSFYNEEMDPFIPAMAEFLQEGGKRANLPAFLRGVGKESKRRHDDNIVIMRSVSEEVVRDRIEHPNDRKDL
jgi:cytochrome P450 / NADPH-cytochrome P450 reductase